MPLSAATWRYSLWAKWAYVPSAAWKVRSRSDLTPTKKSDSTSTDGARPTTALERSWSLGDKRADADLVVQEGHGGSDQADGDDGQDDPEARAARVDPVDEEAREPGGSRDEPTSHPATADTAEMAEAATTTAASQGTAEVSGEDAMAAIPARSRRPRARRSGRSAATARAGRRRRRPRRPPGSAWPAAHRRTGRREPNQRRAQVHPERHQEAHAEDEPGRIGVGQRGRQRQERLRREWPSGTNARPGPAKPISAPQPEASQGESCHLARPADQWAHRDERGGETQHAGAEWQEAPDRLRGEVRVSHHRASSRNAADQQHGPAVGGHEHHADREHHDGGDGGEEAVGGPETPSRIPSTTSRPKRAAARIHSRWPCVVCSSGVAHGPCRWSVVIGLLGCSLGQAGHATRIEDFRRCLGSPAG